MAVKSFDEIVEEFISRFLALRPNANLIPGTLLRDVMIDVPSFLMADLYLAIQQTQLAQSIERATGDDLDRYLENFGIYRRSATKATGRVWFQRNSPPPTDIEIPKNTLLSTVPTVYKPAVHFVTTATVTLYGGANAESQYNAEDGVYEVSAPIEAVEPGAFGNVGANLIVNAVGLTGVDNVTNKTATTGGADEEDDESLRARALTVLTGTNFGTKDGIYRLVLQDSEISGIAIVTPQDSSQPRDRVFDGGADVYIKSSVTAEAVESFEYDGEVYFYPSNKPALAVTVVKEGSTALVEGVDWIFEKDFGPFGRSLYAQDRIRFITPRTLGETISITYQYSAKVQDVQQLLNSEQYRVVTSDVLVKAAWPAEVEIGFTISVLAGYSKALVKDDVATAVSQYIEGLSLGEDVQQSEVIAVIEGVEGVDGVYLPLNVFRVVRPDGTVDGPGYLSGVKVSETGDLIIPGTQYATLSVLNVSA